MLIDLHSRDFLDSGWSWLGPAPNWVAMAVSAQRLLEELQIFGQDCEEELIEKCESLAPSRTLARVHALAPCSQRLEPRGERFHLSPPLGRTRCVRDEQSNWVLGLGMWGL